MLVFATIAIFAALSVGAIVATSGLIRAERALTCEAAARIDEAKQRRAQSSGQVADEVTRFLADMLASVDPNRALGKPVLVRDVLEAQATSLPIASASSRSSARTCTASSAIRITRWVNSKRRGTAQAALETRRKVRGSDHPDTLNSINDVATILEAEGRRSEAETLRRELLQRRTALLGPDDPETLKAEDTLSVVLNGLERAAEAEPLARHALDVRRRMLGDDHPDTLSSMNNVAGITKALDMRMKPSSSIAPRGTVADACSARTRR